MDVFLKACSIVLITAVLSLFLGKWEKDTAILLSIAACCIAGAAAVFYIEPILSFLEELEEIAQLQNGLLGILFKAVGITFMAELAGMICSDSGNGALAKMMQFLSSGTVLYLSIPIFRSVLQLLTDIIGEL